MGGQLMGEWMPTEGGNKGVVKFKPKFEFKVGDFVSETLVTDTRTYEVVATTAKTIKVRTTSQGDVVKSESRDGNPWPLTWTEVVSDPNGRVFTLRLRKDGTYRMGDGANRLRPATVVDGKPTSYTDYRF